MQRYMLEIGRTDNGGLHLNLIDENGRATDQITLGELLEQITVLAMAQGWPRRSPEFYEMLTPQQWALRRERIATNHT